MQGMTWTVGAGFKPGPSRRRVKGFGDRVSTSPFTRHHHHLLQDAVTICYTSLHNTPPVRENPKTPEMTVSQDDRPAGAPAGTPSSTPRHEEYQYLDLVREILEEGELRQDR